METNSFRKFAIDSTSGGIAASFTHLIVVPLDVVKTKIQLDHAIANSAQAFQTIQRDIGAIRTLSLGITPTVMGYYLQGVCKYGLYDNFKSTLFDSTDNVFVKNIISASCAEAIGDIFLSPFEAIRIRQVSEHKLNYKASNAVKEIWSKEGILGFYKGFPPLLLKQIPYTASKFAVYEASKQSLHHLNIFRGGDNEMPLIVCAAIAGGLVSAIVSHPADTLLTCINSQDSKGLRDAVKRMIARGVWAGLLPRLIMVGGLASLQLIIFEACRAGMAAKFHEGKKPWYKS